MYFDCFSVEYNIVDSILFCRSIIAISEFPGPVYRNEVKCAAFDMEMIFHSHANKLIFTRKAQCNWSQFESEGSWNSEVAFCHTVVLAISCTTATQKSDSAP